MFLTLEDAKSFLWIEDNDYDVEIGKLIQDSETLLGSLLGYKDTTMELQTFTRWVYFSDEEGAVIIPEYNIIEITKLSNENYTGVENIDFIKEGLKKVNFIIPFPIEVINSKVFMEYLAWYTELTFPEELRLALKYLVSGLWNTKENIWIKSCKTGQESCSYTSISDQNDLNRIIKTFKRQPDLIIF